MATASVPNSFTNGVNADATKINDNFSAITSFLNNDVEHKDSRRRVRLRRVANQALSAGPNNITWDTEDVDTSAFIVAPSATITVPAGAAGVYVITVAAQTLAGTTTWLLALSAGVGTFSAAPSTANSSTHKKNFWVTWLDVGDTVTAQINSLSGADTLGSARLAMTRIAE